MMRNPPGSRRSTTASQSWASPGWPCRRTAADAPVGLWSSATIRRPSVGRGEDLTGVVLRDGPGVGGHARVAAAHAGDGVEVVDAHPAVGQGAGKAEALPQPVDGAGG